MNTKVAIAAVCTLAAMAVLGAATARVMSEPAAWPGGELDVNCRARALSAHALTFECVSDPGFRAASAFSSGSFVRPRSGTAVLDGLGARTFAFGDAEAEAVAARLARANRTRVIVWLVE